MNEFKTFLYNVVLRHLVNELYNFANKYLDSKTQAFDELISDVRNYELDEIAWSVEPKFPDEFAFEVHYYVNQRKPWYTMSCTAQATAECGNLQRKVKADETRKSWFILWDDMVRLWLWDRKRWAYLIHAIKQGKKDWVVEWYYQTKTINAMKSAIYNYSNLIATWSNKIDWNLLKKTDAIVSISSSWYWHAFYIRWWNKLGWLCVNSNWHKDPITEFIIPFNLTFDVLFKSTYALVVNPEWTKLSKEELFSKYKLKNYAK